jgi:hypothetical protein
VKVVSGKNFLDTVFSIDGRALSYMRRNTLYHSICRAGSSDGSTTLKVLKSVIDLNTDFDHTLPTEPFDTIIIASGYIDKRK